MTQSQSTDDLVREMPLDEALDKARRYANDEKFKDMPSVSRTMLAAYTAEKARGDRLEKALRDHNDECQALCGIGDQEAVRCGYRPYLLGSGRRCPECPTYMMIECAALGDSNREPRQADSSCKM